MSYDVSLRSPRYTECTPATHGEFYHRAYPCELEIGTPTYNLEPMFRKAFSIKRGLSALDGKLGRTETIIIPGAIFEMETRPDDFRALNPENGWGNYESALAFLRVLAQACKELPNWTISVT